MGRGLGVRDRVIKVMPFLFRHRPLQRCDLITRIVNGEVRQFEGMLTLLE